MFIEDLFRRKWVRARIRANPIKVDLERYLAYLANRGHSTNTCRQYVVAAEHFGRWLGRRSLTRAVVRQFIRWHLPVCRCPVPAVRNFNCNSAALNRLLEMNGVAQVGFEFPRGLVGDLLGRYQERLVTVRGLAATTVHNRLVYARTMLTDLRIRRLGQLLSWTPEKIERYICGKASHYPPATGQAIACAARSLLRFLLQEGLTPRDLATAVPTFARWRLTSLPESLGEDEVARLINAADVRMPMGLRDRAMVLCMSELGLRVSDVAGLELDGVDVTARVLRLRCHKERESTVLPLTSKLAGALDAYLRRGRPICTSQAVFVVHQAPVGNPITAIGIRGVVKRLAARAGLRHRVNGTHVLRHSVACRMLGAGANLKQIADLLGHQSINTTTIYAKVDLNALSAVALPWPGAKEVQR